MTKKRYDQWINVISVRARDNPAEYAREYYHLVIKGRDSVPLRKPDRS